MIAAHLPAVAIGAAVILTLAGAGLRLWHRGRASIECGLDARDA
jgi:hypothetical protein